jgi:hypothetical protein
VSLSCTPELVSSILNQDARPQNGSAHICVSHFHSKDLHLTDPSCRDYRGLKKKITAIRQERAAGPERHSLRITSGRVLDHFRSISHTTGTVTRTPVVNQSQGDADAPPIRSVTSIERGAQQNRSPLTFRTASTTEGILNNTPGIGPSGRVYGTFSPRESNLEGTNPPEMRLPPPIQSVPEQPEPEEASAPRRGHFLARSSFALPPPALPTPHAAVCTPHSPFVLHFLINSIGTQ